MEIYRKFLEEDYNNDLGKRFRIALNLIKKHITFEKNEQNKDLHNAIGILVTIAREKGII